MDKPQQAEVVTIKEAVEKVKNWIKEKDFEKAKQGCKEILAVEKDNAEVKALLEESNKGLGGAPKAAPATPATPEKVNEVIPKPETKPEIKEKPKEAPTPTPTPALAPKQEKAPTPDMIMKPDVKKEEKKEEEKKKEPKPKKHFPLGKLIAIIVLLGIAGGLVFTYLQGWLNPAFEWLLGLLGL